MENEWNNLRFHLTEEMNNMMIELLVTEQMMKENKLTKKEKIRQGLGCDEFPSKYSDFDLFIYSCDQG